MLGWSRGPAPFHFNGPEQMSDSMPAGPEGVGTSEFVLEDGGCSC